MSNDEKKLAGKHFFFRRQKICWVGSLEKLKINYVWPNGRAKEMLLLAIFSVKNTHEKIFRPVQLLIWAAEGKIGLDFGASSVGLISRLAMC